MNRAGAILTTKERKQGNQAQEQKITECIFLEAIGKLLNLGAGLADQDIAEGGLGDQENGGSTDCGGKNRDDRTEDGTEQKAAKYTEQGCTGQ